MKDQDLLKAVSDKICNLLKDTKHDPMRVMPGVNLCGEHGVFEVTGTASNPLNDEECYSGYMKGSPCIMPVKNHGCTNHGIPYIKEAEVLAALELTEYRFRFSMAVDCIIVEGRSRCSWKLGELLIDQDWVTLDFLYDELLIDND